MANLDKSIAGYNQVIDFWFKETTPVQWFKKDDNFDAEIKNRFLKMYESAIKGELFNWRQNAEGRLAEIIVLDQFSRNIFRNSAKAFAYDSLAVVLAQEAVAGKFDQALSVNQKAFLYMPMMHSESLIIHKQAEALFSQPGLEDNYRFELSHKVIIERFGRYPHRNELLSRKSTPEEIEFLLQPGSSF